MRTLPRIVGLAALAMLVAGRTHAQHAHMHASAEADVGLHFRLEDDAFILEYGPMTLPARSDHHAVSQPATRSIALPVDGWMSGYSVDIIDAAGKPLPRTLLHHVNVISAMQRELFSDIMLRVAAAGPETAPLSFPSVIGYRFRQGDTVIVSAMMENPTDRDYVATLRIRFPFKRATSRIGALSIFPFYMDVMPPTVPHSFDLPPGRSEKYWEGKPAIAGRLLGVGGHMHAYGKLLRLEDRTAGKILWEGKPTVDSTGAITGFPITKFVTRLGLSLRSDHVYRLTAFYDNPTSAVIPDGGMGALGGVFLPSRDVKWPQVNRASTDYRIDVAGTWRTNSP
jgi:hypothetical protein